MIINFIVVEPRRRCCGIACPGDTGKSCSGHGECDDGVFGSGVCTCRSEFTGRACETCLADTCVHGAIYVTYLLLCKFNATDEDDPRRNLARIFGARSL